LNVNGDNNVRQTKIHTAEPLVTEPSAFEVEMATETSEGTNHQIFIQLQQNCFKQEEGQFPLKSKNLLILCGMKRNCPVVEGVNHCAYLQEGL
jgi:hypothetical protein